MIQDAVDFIRSKNDKPWLLLGKGPTFQHRDKLDLHKYHLLTLNHVCTMVEPVLAHFTDIEAWKNCAGLLVENNCTICLPWYPHTHMKSGSRTLRQFVDANHALYWHYLHKKLYSYNSTLSKLMPNEDLCTIRVKSFSGVAGFNLLAAAGQRLIYTLGIDGGKQYSPEFDPADKLANGQQDFDAQFVALSDTCKKAKVQWKPLL